MTNRAVFPEVDQPVVFGARVPAACYHIFQVILIESSIDANYIQSSVRSVAPSNLSPPLQVCFLVKRAAAGPGHAFRHPSAQQKILAILGARMP